MLPMKLLPAFIDYIWGGERLKTEYNKKTDMSPLAESWDISCHPDGESVVSGGKYGGEKLSRVVERYGKLALLGENSERFPYFPVMVKYIDAKAPLSLQVHPDDSYALAHENSFGKTEMWIVLSAEPGSFLYMGVNREISRAELKAAIEGGTLEALLNKRYVRKGDVLFIPAGELHAIGEGVLILEIQQNSNLTYRVYDYSRRDKSGNLRELHIEKALAVSHLTPPAESNSASGVSGSLPAHSNELPPAAGGAVELLAECGYFSVSRIELSGAYTLYADGSTFYGLCCTEGEAELHSGGELMRLIKGETAFVPADSGECTLKGVGEVISIHIPKL